MMRAWHIMLLALGGLRRTRFRVALTALGVTIASGALVSMVAFALGIQAQAEAPFKALGLINVIRISPEKGDDAPALDDEALTRIEALPGVEVAYPEFRVRGIEIARGEHKATVMAVGVPRQVPLIGTADDLIVAGEYFTPGDAPEAILAVPLARELGFETPEAAVGATVTLNASGLAPDDAETFTFTRKDLTVTIAGVYALPSMMPGRMGRVVLLPVDVMKDIPGIRAAPALDRLRDGREGAGAGYARATVRVRRHTDLAPVEAAIQAMGFQTRTLLSRLEKMRTFFVVIDVLLAAVGTVALVVAGLGIINTLLISVLERTQEIGICKAIGASDGDLVVLFLTEAGIIGLLGGVGGIVLGRAASWLLELAVNAYARSQGLTTHLDLFAFPLWLLAATAFFSVAVSVLAGVYPAFRAARVDPIQALRRE